MPKEKETISPKTNIPIPIPKSTAPKPMYKYAGVEKTSQSIGKSIPKQLIPTKRLASIIGLIFLAAIILSLIQFPFGKMLSGNMDITIEIGYPLPFLELGIATQEESPLRILNLLLDLIIYIILAYAIDIILNLILNNDLIKSKEELKGQPAVYKNIKPTIADKIIKKTFGEDKK